MSATFRDIADDGRQACALAVVALHEGENTHWRINDDGDLEVDVLTHSHQVPVTAILGALVGGKGRGVWMVPALGTEVAIVFDGDDFESDAVIVGVMPTGAAPDGLADGKVVIAGIEVLVHDGNGGAAALATKADLEALRDAIVAWVPAPMDGGAALKTQFTTLFTGPPLWPTGTTVLKAK